MGVKSFGETFSCCVETRRSAYARIWVAPGDYSPRAPADPDVQISRIRFLRSRVRYAINGMDGTGRR